MDWGVAQTSRRVERLPAINNARHIHDLNLVCQPPASVSTEHAVTWDMLADGHDMQPKNHKLVQQLTGHAKNGIWLESIQLGLCATHKLKAVCLNKT